MDSNSDKVKRDLNYRACLSDMGKDMYGPTLLHIDVNISIDLLTCLVIRIPFFNLDFLYFYRYAIKCKLKVLGKVRAIWTLV